MYNILKVGCVLIIYKIFLLVLLRPPWLYLLKNYATVDSKIFTACGKMVKDITPWVMGLVQAATVILPIQVSSQNRFCFISPSLATWTRSYKASPPPRAHDD